MESLRSKKNDNIYILYKDRIVVQTVNGTKELTLPSDDYVCFYSIYYIQDKLFAILITGGRYDMRLEIDEDTLAFTGSPIPTY